MRPTSVCTFPLSSVYLLSDDLSRVGTRFATPRAPAGRIGGATIDYRFGEVPDTTVSLAILDGDGSVVRSFSGDSSRAEENETPILPAEQGINRIHWSLREDGIDPGEDAVVWRYTGGLKVPPGSYTVRLGTTQGDTFPQPLDVQMDPHLRDVPTENFRAQFDLATTLRDTTNAVYDAVRTLRSVREQVTSVAEHAQEVGHEGLTQRADSIAGTLTSTEEELLQTNNESFQDPLNVPPQLDNQYAYVPGPNGPLTEGARARFEDLNEQWRSLRDRLQTVLETDVADFRRRVREFDTEPIFVPASDP